MEILKLIIWSLYCLGAFIIIVIISKTLDKMKENKGYNNGQNEAYEDDEGGSNFDPLLFENHGMALFE